MRSCSAWAMSLNDAASDARSGSAAATRRVSSRPPAMASAAGPTSPSGREASGDWPTKPRSAAGDGRHQRRAEQDDGQRLERVLDVDERDALEVLRAGRLGIGTPMTSVRLVAVVGSACGAGCPPIDLSRSDWREVVLAELAAVSTGVQSSVVALDRADRPRRRWPADELLTSGRCRCRCRLEPAARRSRRCRTTCADAPRPRAGSAGSRGSGPAWCRRAAPTAAGAPRAKVSVMRARRPSRATHGIAAVDTAAAMAGARRDRASRRQAWSL